MSGATSTQEPVYTPSDVWVLLAIAFACARRKNSATLLDVVEWHDGVRHLGVCGAELRRALSKLTHDGRVTDLGGVYSLSGDARELWLSHCEDVSKESRWWHDAFERLLNPDPDHEPNNYLDDDPAWPYPQLSDQIVDAARMLYSKKVWGPRDSN